MSLWLRQPHKTGGIALPFVLLILALMIVIITTVVKQGFGTLHQAKAAQFSKQSLFAAEAGAADALRRLIEDPTWLGPLPNASLPSGGRYSAEITNNLTGAGVVSASNGAVVPPGFAYILATGTRPDGSYPRRAGLLTSTGSTTALGFALGAGGDINLQGSKNVSGSLKASGDIRLQGSTRITPLNGAGRLLAGGSLTTQGSTRMDEAQDARARGAVSTTPAINGAYLVQGGDTSPSTLPFIADGRYTNALTGGEQGQVLPNPDPSALINDGNPAFVRHDVTETTLSSLNLNGRIHYFPGGISFSGSNAVTGPGTIVAGEGNGITFQGSTGNLEANLIALRRPDQFPAAGTPSISFQGSTNITGLIYAHEDVTTQGSFTLNGVMIAYRPGGGNIRTQGSTNITLDSSVFAGIPGFEPWANGFGGTGGITPGAGALTVFSWEKF